MANISLSIAIILIAQIIIISCLNHQVASQPLSSPSPSPSPPPCHNREVLQEFKRKIYYDPYNNTDSWSPSSDCNACCYSGVVCSPYSANNVTIGVITSIDFRAWELAGIGLCPNVLLESFPHLISFRASRNNFSCAVTNKLGHLYNLQELDLGFSNLSGFFPTTALDIKSLSTLDLQSNALSGCLPNNTGNLTDLKLAQNHFSGKIPGSFCKMLRKPAGAQVNISFNYLTKADKLCHSKLNVAGNCIRTGENSTFPQRNESECEGFKTFNQKGYCTD